MIDKIKLKWGRSALQISEDYSVFSKSALRAKSTTKPNSLCHVIARYNSEQYRRYNNGTVKLYQKVKKDQNDVVTDIYALIYNKEEKDEDPRNKHKHELQKRLQKIYDTIKTHEWYSKKHLAEMQDIYIIGIMQPPKLFSHFLAKNINEKFSAYFIESKATRKISSTTFTCISRELNMAILNVPKENVSFSISK